MKILFLKIATVLKISTYQFWYEQECANIILSGPKQIKEIYFKFIKEDCPQLSIVNEDPLTPSLSCPITERCFSFLYNSQKSSEAPKEPSRRKIEKELDAEVIKFTDIISKKINHTRSEKNFWEKFTKDLPKLTILYVKINSLPATSAFIERFFSLTGLVCEKRRMRMTEDLIEKRAILKANMTTLEKLCVD